MPSRRDPGLDAARAIAMMFVVATHAAISFMVTPVGWAVQDRSQHLAVDLYVWIVRAFAMPTFFWLSGYFARQLLDGAGLRAFVRNRAVRIALPLVVALVPVSLAVDALWDWGRAAVPRAAIATTAPRFEGSELPIQLGHLWFLYYLILMSALGALAARLRVRIPDRAVAAIPLVVTGAVLVGTHAMHPNTPLGFVPDLAVLAFNGAFFAWGWLVQGRPLQLARMGELAWFALAIAALQLGIAVACLARGTAPAYGSLAAAAFGVLVVAGFLGLCVRYGRVHPLLRLGADASYWIYIAHLPIVVALQIWLAPLPLFGPLKYLAIIATTTLAVLGSYALWRRARR